MQAQPLLFVAAGLALAVGLFLAMRPAPEPEPAAPPVSETPLAGTEASLPQEAATQFELVVRGRRLVSGPAVLQVRQGEQVILRVTSDEADELHLHGYDLSLSLAPGERGSLVFVAEQSGRFEYELERSHTGLGVLEVAPR